MFEVWSRPTYKDEWASRVNEDLRFEGLLQLSNAICDVVEPGWAEEDGRELDRPSPLQLAGRLREAAQHIEQLTRDGHYDAI